MFFLELLFTDESLNTPQYLVVLPKRSTTCGIYYQVVTHLYISVTPQNICAQILRRLGKIGRKNSKLTKN